MPAGFFGLEVGLFHRTIGGLDHKLEHPAPGGFRPAPVAPRQGQLALLAQHGQDDVVLGLASCGLARPRRQLLGPISELGGLVLLPASAGD